MSEEQERLLQMVARLVARSVRADDGTGCLRWTGTHNPKGYGQVVVEGQLRQVHRVAHKVWLGPIPDGHEGDHVHARGCRWRDCIEPRHLEAVTHAENVARSLALVTHCPNGHELTEANVKPYRTTKGYIGRKCRTCFNENRAAWRANRKASA